MQELSGYVVCRFKCMSSMLQAKGSGTSDTLRLEDYHKEIGEALVHLTPFRHNRKD